MLDQSQVNAFNVRLDADYDVKPRLDKALADDITRDAQQFVERAAAHLQEQDNSKCPKRI